MQDSDVPVKIPTPWGTSAGGAYIRPIPIPSQIGIQDGAASFTDGFPPDCLTPVVAGGVPPFGQDMNGILQVLSQWNRWQAAGGPNYYDSTFASAIGGYPKGALLASTTIGNFWYSTADNNTTNPDAGGAGWAPFPSYLAPFLGAARRSTTSKFSDTVSVLDFGADPTGVADSTAAFNAAIANSGGRPAYMPGGNYFCTGTLHFLRNGDSLVGDGPGLSNLVSSASGHALLSASGISSNVWQDFSLTRSGVPISGQNGIHLVGVIEQASIQNVTASGFWTNYRLCATGYSEIIGCFGNNAYSHNCNITNADAVAAGLQWNVKENLFQFSNGWGVLWQGVTGGSAVVGPVNQWLSFANTLGGMAYKGSVSSPINGVRVYNSFSGQEGNDSLYVDSYGTTEPDICNVYTEANGFTATGVNGAAAAASHQGHGINITVNNQHAKIVSCQAIEHSWSGIITEAGRSLIVGCACRINGQAALPGDTSGIQVQSGQATVVGNQAIGNNYGIFLVTDGGAEPAPGGSLVMGNDCQENATAGIAAAVPLVFSIVQGNIPALAWTAYTPTINLISGSGSSYTIQSARFQRIEKTVSFEIFFTIVANGGATGLSVTLPLVSNSPSVIAARRTDIGITCQGFIGNLTNLCNVTKYDNTYPGADGAQILVSGTYEAL